MLLYEESGLRDENLQDLLDQLDFFFVQEVASVWKLHLQADSSEAFKASPLQEMLELLVNSLLLGELEADRFQDHEIFLGATLLILALCNDGTCASQLSRKVADLAGFKPLLMEFYQKLQSSWLILSKLLNFHIHFLFIFNIIFGIVRIRRLKVLRIITVDELSQDAASQVDYLFTYRLLCFRIIKSLRKICQSFHKFHSCLIPITLGIGRLRLLDLEILLVEQDGHESD